MELKEGIYHGDKWNEMVPIIKKRCVDISEPLSDQTAYIFSGAFRGVIFDPETKKFFKVRGAFDEVEIQECGNKTMNEVFDRR